MSSEVKFDIIRIMNILNINRMPTSKEVASIDSSVGKKIRESGGYTHWASILNISNIGEGVSLSDENIKPIILECMEYHNIDRMPTSKEMNEFDGGRSSYSNLVSKSRGFRGWAKHLGLKIKESGTQFGQDGEDISANKLESMGYSAEILTTIAPYDMLIDSNVRIDIKSAREWSRNGTATYAYSMGSSYHKCDIFICLGFDKEGVGVQNWYVIPSHMLNVSTLYISKGQSKYDRFENMWDYIDNYSKFYRSIE